MVRNLTFLVLTPVAVYTRELLNLSWQTVVKVTLQTCRLQRAKANRKKTDSKGETSDGVSVNNQAISVN